VSLVAAEQYGRSLSDNWQLLSAHVLPSAFIAAMIGSEKNTVSRSAALAPKYRSGTVTNLYSIDSDDSGTTNPTE
jgi:hypothetical protein